MSSIKKNILTISEPSLDINDITIPDLDTIDISKEYGDKVPVIRINAYEFGQQDILKFSVNMHGFLPVLNLSVSDAQGMFKQRSYPRDGDLIELYIASPDDNVYKPIRCDFFINSVASKTNDVYRFDGVLYIPEIFKEDCKSYEEDSSFNHLLSTADELQIGFASNIENSNDIMKRINAFDTLEHFIKKTSMHSYKDEESFFDSYVDMYYYLNFVDVNAQFNSVDDELEESLMVSSENTAIYPDDNKNINQIDAPLILSNIYSFKGTRNYIKSYKLVNNTGVTNKKNGYTRVLQYYDFGDLTETNSIANYLSFEVNPLASNKIKDGSFTLNMTGARDNQQEEIIKYKFLGKHSGTTTFGNTHDNYKYAAIQNLHNIEEVNKISLIVELENANMALYKYQQVPVGIFIQDPTTVEEIRFDIEKLKEIDHNVSGDRQAAIDEYITMIEEDLKIYEDSEELRDSVLSGIYIIGNIEYKYRKGDKNMTQVLTLLRREWPVWI